MAADATATPRFDVIVAGAGLPGLALASALARGGLRVALADRAPIAAPEEEGDGFDLQVYAISPGSARFLGDIGAWPRLPAERVTAIEAMDVRGDAGGRLGFSAYDVGERALAWIVEERALRAALLHGAYEAGVLVQAPFRIALPTRALKRKVNQLAVEVTTLAANRIRDLDRRGVSWKIFRDINFVNDRYKPFDASGWELMDGGLLGPVTLVPSR